jgi:hypothetical protein
MVRDPPRHREPDAAFAISDDPLLGTEKGKIGGLYDAFRVRMQGISQKLIPTDGPFFPGLAIRSWHMDE